MDYKKIIIYLIEQVKKYNDGDKKITYNEHQMNIMTLKHFKEYKK